MTGSCTSAHSAPEHFGKSFLRHASDVCCRTCLSCHGSSFRRHMGRWSHLLRRRVLTKWTGRSNARGNIKPFRRRPIGHNGYEIGIYYDNESQVGLNHGELHFKDSSVLETCCTISDNWNIKGVMSTWYHLSTDREMSVKSKKIFLQLEWTLRKFFDKFATFR